jgi:uncharacterized protein (DUF934 family)
MRVTYSYESILRAVGQVLEQDGVHHITLREMHDGLFAEGTHRDQTPYQHLFTAGELCNLIDRVEGHVEDLFAPQDEARTLREFLARHEVVAAR